MINDDPLYDVSREHSNLRECVSRIQIFTVQYDIDIEELTLQIDIDKNSFYYSAAFSL